MKRSLFTLFLLLLLVGMTQGVPIEVNNTSDSGSGSLRWAIEQANLNPGLDQIIFNIYSRKFYHFR